MKIVVVKGIRSDKSSLMTRSENAVRGESEESTRRSNVVCSD